MNKRLIAAVSAIVITALLSGCTVKEYSLSEGMYVPETIEDGQVTVPYILIQDQRFTIVQDMALSYQPSGNIERKQNEVVMETTFADQECRWVFELADNDTIKFLEDRSSLPQSDAHWKDKMTFILTDIDN